MRFRAKSLTSLLFAFLLALPMISVISKVIYVQSNKNAYESYSNSGVILKSNTVSPTSSLITSNLYTFKVDMSQGVSGSSSIVYKYSYISIDWEDYGAPSGYNYNAIQFYKGNNGYNVYLKENDNVITTLQSAYIDPNLKLTFALIPSQDYTQNGNQPFLISTNVFEESKLDNVFEYAVDEVIKENNFGNIDFFSYFTSIFMFDNQVNNRYIGYVNYYLNYALMVSLAYLLFLMLMWFVNFARRFLDRGMNYDW